VAQARFQPDSHHAAPISLSESYEKAYYLIFQFSCLHSTSDNYLIHKVADPEEKLFHPGSPRRHSLYTTIRGELPTSVCPAIYAAQVFY
jgi:hypothetical protein